MLVTTLAIRGAMLSRQAYFPVARRGATSRPGATGAAMVYFGPNLSGRATGITIARRRRPDPENRRRHSISHVKESHDHDSH